MDNNSDFLKVRPETPEEKAEREKAEKNNGFRNEEEKEEKYKNDTIKDIEDIELLQVQAQVELIFVIAYYLEYVAAYQGIEIIRARMAKRDEDYYDGAFTADSSYEEVEKDFKRSGIDVDWLEYFSGFLNVYSQIFQANIDTIKLDRVTRNDTQDDKYQLTVFANQYNLYGSVGELISYLWEYEAAAILYEISNENMLFD